jgi:hypothetical protein
LDKGVTVNNEALLHFIGEYRQEHGKAGDAIHAIRLRLEAIASSVGTVPTYLAVDYLSPSAWASIEAMAAKLDDVWKDLKVHKTKLNLYKSKVNAMVENQIQLGQEEYFNRLEEFKKAFISASRSLERRLDNVELKLIGIQETFTRYSSSELLSNPTPFKTNTASARLHLGAEEASHSWIHNIHKMRIGDDNKEASKEIASKAESTAWRESSMGSLPRVMRKHSYSWVWDFRPSRSQMFGWKPTCQIIVRAG